MPTDPTFNAACKNCRLAKVKCNRVDDEVDAYKGEKCRRCRGDGWDCSLMPRAARKRRKKMDARVEDLEGQVREMEALMEKAKGRSGGEVEKLGGEMGWVVRESMKDVPTMMLPLTPHSEGLGKGSMGMASGSSMAKERSNAATVETMPTEMVFEETTTLSGIVPALLDVSHAQRLLTKFITSTVAQFPLVLLSSNTTFSHLATTRPTLLLAMITAASMSEHGALFKQLHDELTKRLAMKVIVGGERSLELVQALLVMEVWYCFPDDLDEGVNFYQWIHIAATMALQLGLGSCSWAQGEDLERAMEEARILLAVYASCSSAAVSLRRENVTKLTPSLQECLEKFGQHATSIHDKCLLARVKLQMISEEAQGVTPSQDHVRGSFLSKTTDLTSQVYCFLRQLGKWEAGLEEGVMNEDLLIHYLYCKVKILEIPLHAYHDLTRLIAYPFLYDNNTADQTIPSMMAPVYMRVALPFLEANHKLLQTFASISPDVLANCPTVPFVRAIYAMNALRILIKGPLFEADVVTTRRIEDVNGRVQELLSAAAGQEMRRVPLAVLGVWTRMGGQRTYDMFLSGAAMDNSGENTPQQPSWEQTSEPWALWVASHMGCTSSGSSAMPDFGDMNGYPTIPDYSCSHVQPSSVDIRMMQNFPLGFGAADLIS